MDRLEKNDDKAEKAARRKSGLAGSALGRSGSHAPPQVVEASGSGHGHGHGSLSEDGPRRPGGGAGLSLGQPGPQQAESSAAAGKRVVSALQMQQQKKNKQLAAVGAPEKLAINTETINRNFEEWMKLATDNVRLAS